jgi:hypothetical protein
MMKLNGQALVATGLLALAGLTAAPAMALPVYWADWTAATTGASGSAQGTITVDNGDTVGVTYSGDLAFASTSNSPPGFWTGPDNTYQSAAVDNRPDNGDILAISASTSRTLTFSTAVDNLFFAVVSLNGNGYLFDHDFTVESFGAGYYGNGTLTKQVTNDGRFMLVGSGEGHGVIRFNEAVSSITWSSQTAEYWNGFTVGTYGTAPVAAVPEPETYAMMACGLAVVGFMTRRRSRNRA